MRGKTHRADGRNEGLGVLPQKEMNHLLESVADHWKEFNPWTGIALFALYILVDLLYATYTLAVTKLQPVKAATVGAGMYVLLAAGVISYSSNPLYLVPIGMGSWLGTFVAVHKERRQRAMDETKHTTPT